MNILNIHGYGGSPHNAAYAALEAVGCGSITSLAIDYDKETPAQLFDRLREAIAENKIGYIVGTSLGGFFAAVLSAELHLPVILINPCLMPFLHLPRLGFAGDVRQFIPLFAKLTALDTDCVSCIVGDADEVIDTHDVTERLVGNSRFRRVLGGKHSGATLPLEDYFREVLPYKMRVTVYSREAVERIIAEGKFPQNTAVISFFDPADKHLDDYTHVDYSRASSAVYYCELDDLDRDYLAEKGYTYESFFPDAADVAAFIRRAHQNRMDIICQCDYGQSRSAGCAAAILEYYYHSGISIFAGFDYYPNQVVYHKVFDALCEK